MPKVVDHALRRRQIAEAVHRLIDAHGIDRVSLREVAAEAGVSMGLVQHYFTTKDEMLLLAMEHLHLRITERVGQVSGSPREVLRAAILELLPLDEVRRSEARIGTAYLARSVVAGDLARVLRDGLPFVLGFYAGVIGAIRPDLDAEREASALFAMAQGLVHPALIGYYGPEAVEAIVDGCLDRLFDG
ncbi:TetR/AcrR family transcriptional regulator [Nonomuraea sp. NPDC050790]|uniref:TetR/AcrR family transcriptional regulator n=1 Tax=Nonomuraea sp. NPDC050790 TaxID=3364371 RepID=UPI0037B38218